MNARLTVLIMMMLLLACPILAQEKAAATDDLLDSVEEWLKDNLDDNALEALGQIDRPRVHQFLTEVESSFDPKALSPAGAAGLFQLMPLTACGLGLSAAPQDERFQPEKSARVAARHLRHLRGHFGDWRLALAAYNAGETRVDNLLKRNAARTYEAIAPRLPAETQLYVPKVEATLRKREGRTLADLKMPL